MAPSTPNPTANPAAHAHGASTTPATPADPNGKPKRQVKRLTAQEKREKAVSGIDLELSKAYTAMVRVAEGYMASGDRARARASLDLCQEIMDVGAELKASDDDQP